MKSTSSKKQTQLMLLSNKTANIKDNVQKLDSQTLSVQDQKSKSSQNAQLSKSQQSDLGKSQTNNSKFQFQYQNVTEEFKKQKQKLETSNSHSQVDLNQQSSSSDINIDITSIQGINNLHRNQNTNNQNKQPNKRYQEQISEYPSIIQSDSIRKLKIDLIQNHSGSKQQASIFKVVSTSQNNGQGIIQKNVSQYFSSKGENLQQINLTNQKPLGRNSMMKINFESFNPSETLNEQDMIDGGNILKDFCCAANEQINKNLSFKHTPQISNTPDHDELSMSNQLQISSKQNEDSNKIQKIQKQNQLNNIIIEIERKQTHKTDWSVQSKDSNFDADQNSYLYNANRIEKSADDIIRRSDEKCLTVDQNNNIIENDDLLMKDAKHFGIPPRSVKKNGINFFTDMSCYNINTFRKDQKNIIQMDINNLKKNVQNFSQRNRNGSFIKLNTQKEKKNIQNLKQDYKIILKQIDSENAILQTGTFSQARNSNKDTKIFSFEENQSNTVQRRKSSKKKQSIQELQSESKIEQKTDSKIQIKSNIIRCQSESGNSVLSTKKKSKNGILFKPSSNRSNISPLVIRSFTQDNNQQNDVALNSSRSAANSVMLFVASNIPQSQETLHNNTVIVRQNTHVVGSQDFQKQFQFKENSSQRRHTSKSQRQQQNQKSMVETDNYQNTFYKLESKSYQSEYPSQVNILTSENFMKTRVRVLARFRPLSELEKKINKNHTFQDLLKESIHFDSQDASLIYVHQQSLIQQSENDGQNDCILKRNMSGARINAPKHTFKFDYVFKPTASQNDIYQVVGQNIVNDALNGINSTVLAYGQTGSGKTYTMFSKENLNTLQKLRNGQMEQVGIIPRVAKDIFVQIRNIKNLENNSSKFIISVQMVEIYKENLVDLLTPFPINTGDHILQDQLMQKYEKFMFQKDLKIKESPYNGTYIQGLTQTTNLQNEDQLIEILMLGENNRHVNSTRQNKVSSRSHSICIIQVVQQSVEGVNIRKGVINLVDLAGSERVSKSYAKGEALEEAKKINQSLSALGKVINCIVKNSPHIPYRDSKLTRLLKESLGGNNKTTLIVNCSLHHSQLEETLSTMRFAQSAKLIQNKVVRNNFIRSSSINNIVLNEQKQNSILNEQNNQLTNMVKELKIELDEMKSELAELGRTKINKSITQKESNNYSIMKILEDRDLFYQQEFPSQNQSMHSEIQQQISCCLKAGKCKCKSNLQIINQNKENYQSELLIQTENLKKQLQIEMIKNDELQNQINIISQKKKKDYNPENENKPQLQQLIKTMKKVKYYLECQISQNNFNSEKKQKNGLSQYLKDTHAIQKNLQANIQTEKVQLSLTFAAIQGENSRAVASGGHTGRTSTANDQSVSNPKTLKSKILNHPFSFKNHSNQKKSNKQSNKRDNTSSLESAQSQALKNNQLVQSKSTSQNSHHYNSQNYKQQISNIKSPHVLLQFFNYETKNLRMRSQRKIYHRHYLSHSAGNIHKSEFDNIYDLRESDDENILEYFYHKSGQGNIQRKQSSTNRNKAVTICKVCNANIRCQNCFEFESKSLNQNQVVQSNLKNSIRSNAIHEQNQPREKLQINDTPNFNLKQSSLENMELEKTKRIIWQKSDKLQKRRQIIQLSRQQLVQQNEINQKIYSEQLSQRYNKFTIFKKYEHVLNGDLQQNNKYKVLKEKGNFQKMIYIVCMKIEDTLQDIQLYIQNKKNQNYDQSVQTCFDQLLRIQLFDGELLKEEDEEEQKLDEFKNKLILNSTKKSQNLNTPNVLLSPGKEILQSESKILDWRSKYLVLKNALQIYINTGNIKQLQEQTEIDLRKLLQKNEDIGKPYYPKGLEQQLKNEKQIICTAKMNGTAILIEQKENSMDNESVITKQEKNYYKSKQTIDQTSHIKLSNYNLSCNKNQSLANHPYKVHSFASISRASSSLAAHNQWKPPSLVSAIPLALKSQATDGNKIGSRNVMSQNNIQEQYIHQQSCCTVFPMNTYHSQDSSNGSFKIGGCNFLNSGQKIDKFQIINPQQVNNFQYQDFENNFFINKNTIKAKNNIMNKVNEITENYINNQKTNYQNKQYNNPQSLQLENDTFNSENGSNEKLNTHREILETIPVQGLKRCERISKMNHSRLIGAQGIHSQNTNH